MLAILISRGGFFVYCLDFEKGLKCFLPYCTEKSAWYEAISTVAVRSLNLLISFMNKYH